MSTSEEGFVETLGVPAVVEQSGVREHDFKAAGSSHDDPCERTSDSEHVYDSVENEVDDLRSLPTGTMRKRALEKQRIVVAELSESDTDCQSLRPVASVSDSTASNTRWVWRTRSSLDDNESGLNSDNAPREASPRSRPVKRARGQSPTTSEYAGLTKVKRAYLKLKKKEVAILAEEQVLWMAKRLTKSKEDSRTTDQLVKLVKLGINLVLTVAQYSGCPTVRSSLEQAAETIREAVTGLQDQLKMTSSLRNSNAGMKEELAEMRAELAKIREEALMRRLTLQASNMINTEIASFTHRLLTEKQLWSPPQGNQDMEELVPESMSAAVTTTNMAAAVVTAGAPKPKPAKRKRKRRKFCFRCLKTGHFSSNCKSVVDAIAPVTPGIQQPLATQDFTDFCMW